jgi:hypothetical protein
VVSSLKGKKERKKEWRPFSFFLQEKHVDAAVPVQMIVHYFARCKMYQGEK